MELPGGGIDRLNGHNGAEARPGGGAGAGTGAGAVIQAGAGAWSLN